MLAFQKGLCSTKVFTLLFYWRKKFYETVFFLFFYKNFYTYQFRLNFNLRKWIFLSMKYNFFLGDKPWTRPLKPHNTGLTPNARKRLEAKVSDFEGIFHQVRIAAECSRDKLFQLVCCRPKNITIPVEIVSWAHKKRYLIPYPSHSAMIRLKGTVPSQTARVKGGAKLTLQQLVKNCSPLMKSDSLLPHSQEPASRTYPEINELVCIVATDSWNILTSSSNLPLRLTSFLFLYSSVWHFVCINHLSHTCYMPRPSYPL
jgi:hypothetical protein